MTFVLSRNMGWGCQHQVQFCKQRTGESCSWVLASGGGSDLAQHTPHGAGGRVGGMGAHLTLEDTRGKGRNSVPGTAGQEKLPWTWGQNGARPSSQN